MTGGAPPGLFPGNAALEAAPRMSSAIMFDFDGVIADSEVLADTVLAT